MPRRGRPGGGGAEAALTCGCGRLYLGDRLLAQGPSWLEGAAVEQMGLCFPRRFPQEMLSDLAASEELRRHFGLFRLQERDRRLLERGLGTESPEAEVRGGGMGAGGRSVPGGALSRPLSPRPGAGGGPCSRCAGGGGAGAVPALLARVPAVLHGGAAEVLPGGAELPAG